MRKKTLQRLGMLVDGELEGPEKEMLLEQIQHDPEFRAEYENLLAIRDLFGFTFKKKNDFSYLENIIMEGFLDRVNEVDKKTVNKESKLDKQQKERHSLIPAIGFGFAALIIVAFIGYFSMNTRGYNHNISSELSKIAIQDINMGTKQGVFVAPHRRLPEKETKNSRYMAIVDSYEVSKGVVIVDALHGSKTKPLIIWHIVHEKN